MSILKNQKEKKDDLKTITTADTELEKWENEQLDIFSDIIISILFKPPFKPEPNEE